MKENIRHKCISRNVKQNNKFTEYLKADALGLYKVYFVRNSDDEKRLLTKELASPLAMVLWDPYDSAEHQFVDVDLGDELT